MLFQVPLTLLWFVPVAAFIILLYLLKIRRREVRVPAIFLFPRITTDVRANALWQRLRFNWLMVLQLLAAFLLLIALARPMARGEGLLGKTVVFVLDASASMKATDVKPHRFAEGKRRILRHLNGLRASDQVALIVATGEPRIVAPLSDNHQRLRQALETLQPTDAPADVGSALRLAAALISHRQRAQIVLVSDGAFSEVTDFSPGKAKLIYEVVGGSDRNAGFVTLDAQRQGNRLMLFAILRNFSHQPMRGTLSVFADGRLVGAKELTLPAGKLHGETLLLPSSVRRAALKWECPEDVLPSDDEVQWVGSGRQPIRVLLVGSGNFFLERALALEPECVVDKAPQVPETEKGNGTGGHYDVVIFDGTKPEPVRAKAIWLIGVTDETFVRRTGTVKVPTIVAWEREHPVLRFVDWGAVLIDTALKVRLADWAQSVVDAKETPLVAVGEHKGKRWLFVGFNFLNSDFPLRVGFPIFVANALRWSVEGARWEQGFTLKAGSVVSLVLPTTSATLRHPEGKTERLTVTERRLVLRTTEHIGIYELRAGNLRTEFAVNLLNADESDITPKRSIRLGGKVYAGTTQQITWRELWWLAVLAALLILAVEWLVYVKQS